MATRRHLDSSTILRPGEVDDLDAVMDIMGSAFSARFGEAWTRSQCAGILPMYGVSLTIAEGRNGPSGFSLVRTVADEAELLLLAVDPDAQVSYGSQKPPQITVNSSEVALVHMGRSVSDAFSLEVELRQKNPQGSAGVFFQGRYLEQQPNVYEFQSIELVPSTDGGNSAAQAVVYLATKVKRLHLVVRGAGLESSMSRYLIDRIAALPNVELHTGTEVVGLEGNETTGLTAAVFRDRATGEVHKCPLRHLFLFIGADPNASWLDGCVAVDGKGFVVTGARCPQSKSRPPLP